MPDLSDWIAAAITSSLFTAAAAVVIFLGKRGLETAITHTFNTRLEATRAEFRRDEERLRGEIKRRDDEISALGSGALATLSTRHGELTRRRLDALDQIWSAVKSHAPYRTLLNLTKGVRMDVLFEKDGVRRPEARDVAERLLAMASLNEKPPKLEEPQAARIYVPAPVWALYAAYSAIAAFPYVFLKLGTMNLAESDVDATETLELAKSALPTYAAFIDELKINSIPHLVRPLEEQLLEAIFIAQSGEDFDAAAIAQADAIMKQVAKLAADSDAKAQAAITQ